MTPGRFGGIALAGGQKGARETLVVAPFLGRGPAFMPPARSGATVPHSEATEALLRRLKEYDSPPLRRDAEWPDAGPVERAVPKQRRRRRVH